jgi:hypothetical protein
MRASPFPPSVLTMPLQSTGYYTWSPELASQSKALDIAFVPQLWGPGQSDDFVSQAEGGWSETTLTPLKEIVAFNEPNLAGQALMTPEEGAALWIKVSLISICPPFRPARVLSSPLQG